MKSSEITALIAFGILALAILGCESGECKYVMKSLDDLPKVGSTSKQR
jgi:hypothetical protein